MRPEDDRAPPGEAASRCDTRALAEELARLRAELARLNAQRLFWYHARWTRILWLNFSRGLAFGLGTLVGPALVVSVAIFLLRQIDWLPVIGEWAREISRFLADQTPGAPGGR